MGYNKRGISVECSTKVNSVGVDMNNLLHLKGCDEYLKNWILII